MHKNVTQRKFFFLKLTFSNHEHLVLLLPYMTQLFFSTAFPRSGRNCPQRKTSNPHFLGNDCSFSELFFTVVYVLTGATNDPGLEVPRFTVWGWGQKQIFKTGEKWCFHHCKKSGNLVFLTLPYHKILISLTYWWKIGEEWPTSFWVNRVRIRLGFRRGFSCQRFVGLPRGHNQL